MGAKHSGHEENTEETKLDNKGVIANESGGFHIFEIHAPTVGVGLVFCIAVGIAAVTIIHCFRRFKRRVGRAHQHRGGGGNTHRGFGNGRSHFNDAGVNGWPSEGRRPYYTSRIRPFDAVEEDDRVFASRFVGVDEGLEERLREMLALARQPRRPLPAPRRHREGAVAGDVSPPPEHRGVDDL